MPALKRFPRSKTVKIGLRCLECNRKFIQPARYLFYDLGTFERKQRGEQVQFSEFFIPARVICPHCGSEDRYDLSGWQYLRATLTLLWYKVFPPGPGSWFQVTYMGAQDGRIMHPFELRAWWAERVTRHPDKAEWRVRYANTLRSQGWATEAEAQYRAALDLAPRQTEALINLAVLLLQRDERDSALEYLVRLASLKPKNEKQRQQISLAQEVLNGSLPFDEVEISNPTLPLPGE